MSIDLSVVGMWLGIGLVMITWRLRQPRFGWAFLSGLVYDVWYGLSLGLGAGLLVALALGVFGVRRLLDRYELPVLFLSIGVVEWLLRFVYGAGGVGVDFVGVVVVAVVIWVGLERLGKRGGIYLEG